MTLNVIIPDARVRPFSCGTQAADWQCSNCERCTKNTPPENGMPTCEIQYAICEAWFGDGTVSEQIARRMGIMPDNLFALVWQCDEVDWTPEWIAESRRRRTYRYRFAKWRWAMKRRIRKAISDTFHNWRSKRRFKIADPHADDPDTCWADWVMWATSRYGNCDKPFGGSPPRCATDSIRDGQCWCGKFENGELRR